MKIPTIDFSKCSNNDVAELLFATYERCRWLCERRDKPCDEKCETCPGSISTIDNFNGRSYFRNHNSICLAHEYGHITKLKIRRQCWAELDKRYNK